MVKRVLILGAGFGGLSAAHFLRQRLPMENKITVVDKKDYFMMGFVNLWIMYGSRNITESRHSLKSLGNKGIDFLNDIIIDINCDENSITISKNKTKIYYDYLIVSLGADYFPETITGLVENECFNLYDSEQAEKIRDKVLALKQGKIAFCITNFPYKCPPAPFEAALLVNSMLSTKGTRNDIRISIYSPSLVPLPVAKGDVNQDILKLLEKNKIDFNGGYKLTKVLSKGTSVFDHGSKKEVVNHDFLIYIPPHGLPPVLKRSNLVSLDQNWIEVDKFTLKTIFDNVFAIGDSVNIKVDKDISIPKAGIFAEGQAKVVSQQIIHDICKSKDMVTKYEGKGFCFMETGNENAGFIEANFYSEQGPITKLYSASKESFQKKVEFEKSRLETWL